MTSTAGTTLITPFTPGWQTAVGDFILDIQRNEFNVAITLDDQPALQDIPGYYQQGAGNFWIAICGAQVIGTIALIDIGNGQGALQKMFVHRDYRGSPVSLAHRLLETLQDRAKNHGIHDIYLGTIDRMHAAHRFYEKHGFIAIDKNTLPQAFPLMAVDNRFYRRTL